MSKPRMGALIRATIALAWIAVIIGGLSIFWNNDQTLPASQWADRSATGAAICAAVAYLCAIFSIAWFSIFIVFRRHFAIAFGALLAGMLPALILMWGIAEYNYAQSASIRPLSSAFLSRALRVNALAHTRLFGGSLWLPAEQANAVRMIGHVEETERSKLTELDDFVTQIRQVVGTEASSLIQAHSRPFFAAMITDTANWIAVPRKEQSDAPITEEEWKSFARASIQSELSGSANPPTLILKGFEEYFSRNTDELMDDYFKFRSDALFAPKLCDLTGPSTYNSVSKQHELLGGAFVTYLIEVVQMSKLIELCKVKDAAEFEKVVESKFEKTWKEVCVDFESWLRTEADRLGWDRSRIFHQVDDTMEENQRERISEIAGRTASKIALSKSVSASSWERLLKESRANFEKRMSKRPDIGLEVIAMEVDSKVQLNQPYKKRMRLLKSGDSLWYSLNNSSGEQSIRITSSGAIRAERTANAMTRTSQAITSELEQAEARNIVNQALMDWYLHADLFRELEKLLASDESWSVVELSDGGDQGDWQIILESADQLENRITFTVSPRAGYCVSNIVRRQGENQTTVARKLSLFEGDFVVEQERETAGDRRSTLDASEIITTCHILNEQQKSSFREELNYMSLKQNAEVSATEVPTWISVIRYAMIAAATLTVALGVWSFWR